MSRKEKKKRKTWVIVVGVAGVLLVVGISGLAVAGQKAVKSVNEMTMDDENIYKVKKQDVKSEISTSGTVIGLEEFSYTSPVTAKVEDIKVQVGQTVSEGEMLLTYNADDLGDNLTKVQLQAQSEKAEGSAAYESANKAANKANSASDKVAALNAEIANLEARQKELNSVIATYEAEHGGSNAANQPADPAKGNDTSEDAAENGENSGTESKTYTIDDATYKSAVAELESVAADLAKKQSEAEGQQAVIDAADDAKVTGSTATRIQVTNQLADMNVNEAQETLDAAEAGIVASKKGIVTSVDIVRGALASENQSLITVADANQIGVDFTISKSDLNTIKKGQRARVVVGGKEYEGKVDFVSRVAVNSADGKTGSSVNGRIVLDNPDDNIFLGVSAKVYIFVGEADQTIAVPYQALNSDVDGDFVYVVNKEGLIERKDVTIGLVSDDYYEIKDGIREKDKVITNVTKDMKPGEAYVPGM